MGDAGPRKSAGLREPGDLPRHLSLHGVAKVAERVATVAGHAASQGARHSGACSSDADPSRPLETFTSMSKARRFGFLDYQDSERSFLDLFDRLRAERIIPELSSPPSLLGEPIAASGA